jgi:division protein CdvB (Snf7/Vps24/ESCRT-III family)
VADVLETHAMNIETQLGSARVMRMMQRSGSEISLDLSAHSKYAQEVNQVLSGASLQHLQRSLEGEDFDNSFC